MLEIATKQNCLKKAGLTLSSLAVLITFANSLDRDQDRQTVFKTTCRSWSRGYKTCFMFNSTDHESSTAHKN